MTHTFFKNMKKVEKVWKISETLNFYDFSGLLSFKSKKVGFGGPQKPLKSGSWDPKMAIFGGPGPL